MQVHTSMVQFKLKAAFSTGAGFSPSLSSLSSPSVPSSLAGLFFLFLILASLACRMAFLLSFSCSLLVRCSVVWKTKQMSKPKETERPFSAVRMCNLSASSPGLWACPAFPSAFYVVPDPERMQSNPHRGPGPLITKEKIMDMISSNDCLTWSTGALMVTLSSDVFIVNRSDRLPHGLLFLSLPLLPLQLSPHVLWQ